MKRKIFTKTLAMILALMTLLSVMAVAMPILSQAKEVRCQFCSGSGRLSCRTCYGSGYKTCYSCSGLGYRTGYTGRTTCYICYGRGRLNCTNCQTRGYNVCTGCNGWGTYDDGTPNPSTCSHSWSNYTDTKAATCTQDGIRKYTCKKCGTTTTATLSATGHIFSANAQYCTNGCGTKNPNYKPAKPKATALSAIKATELGFSVSWKKQSGITGYQLQYSTNSNFKNGTAKAVKDKTSLGVTGLKAQAKYYVRIRTYKTYDGKNYFSSWSKACAVTTKKVATPKATTLSKLTAQAAGFTATCNKQSGVTGYQIQYSTNSNFKNGKAKAVKDKTSLSVSDLKGKTKYYVRVRTYKTVTGKNYFSAWSKVKSVTTKAAATFVTIKAETYGAQVSDIYSNPSKYVGKKIQIDGLYDFEDLTSQNGGTYYYVYRLIHGDSGEEDGMCGFEFTTADGKYPSYVPKNGDTNSDHPWIRVTGILQVYYEGEGNNKTAYFTLSKATCQVMNERGAEYI